MSDPIPNHSRAAGSIMASILVLMVGMIGVCSVAFMVNPDQAPKHLLMVLGGFVVFVGLVIGVMPRVPMPTGKIAWFNRRKSREEYLGYSPKLDKPVVTRFGTNAPPTVQEVRDLKDTSRTWVPSRANNRAKRDGKQG